MTIREKEQAFKERFNGFWGKFFPDKNNVYEKIGASGFLELKNAISDINNIITLKVTKLFIERFYPFMGFGSEELMNSIDELSANENGFDVFDKKIIL